MGGEVVSFHAEDLGHGSKRVKIQFETVLSEVRQLHTFKLSREMAQRLRELLDKAIEGCR